jgi:hypothetical protein
MFGEKFLGSLTTIGLQLRDKDEAIHGGKRTLPVEGNPAPPYSLPTILAGERVRQARARANGPLNVRRSATRSPR